jgi:hypothetical protein
MLNTKRIELTPKLNTSMASLPQKLLLAFSPISHSKLKGGFW